VNERVRRLREQSFDTRPSFSAERAVLTTGFYKEWVGRVSTPVLRAMNFRNLCAEKTIYIGDDELIVGERGPRPKATSSFPELTCHSEEDLRILDSRPMTSFAVSEADLDAYRETVIPYWNGRSIRDRAFAQISEEWKALYEAGLFTEFMEQRAPGHTSLDGSIYEKGLNARRAEIATARARLDWSSDPDAFDRDEELKAMEIACEGALIFASRHVELAARMAREEKDATRAAELRAIADICRRVPAEAPATFWEALQMYWFVHLGTITELNGWDAMNPGHLDQHLGRFFAAETAAGTINRDQAKELLSCFWIKVNNTPAPPKVGVTAAESGTYNDFTNINLGGLKADGSDGSNEVSYLVLEVLDELQLLQPQANLQVSIRTPDRLLRSALEVARRGSGYPSFFNADEVIQAQVGMGKSLRDAREGGTSGCIETGCFGKEAYLLHGYLNSPKILELALNDGVDPASGKRIGIATGAPESFSTFGNLYEAYERQLRYVVQVKVRVSNFLDRMFAQEVPAPFLSSVVADCIERGRDYYDGGARYNTDYIQCCGLGTTTDSLSAIKVHVYEKRDIPWPALIEALRTDWQRAEDIRLLMTNRTPKFGNDDESADSIARNVFESWIDAIEGRPTPRGGVYHVDILSTTCHIYFGLRTGATPDGRHATLPISDGASPAQGADRKGPTAVIKSLAKLDIARTGGSLLNQRFLPNALRGEAGIDGLAVLVRTYFKLGGHHIQFNVVDTETLRAAQKRPEDYRSLLVRVAGYSDYFVDLDRNHQEEIISRTAQEAL